MRLDPETNSYNDLGNLFRLRRIVRGLSAAAPPKLVVIQASRGPASKIGLMAGSFNPPTTAHVALANAARRILELSAIYLLCTKVTIDKAEPAGAALEDRLALLQRAASRRSKFGVLLGNCGLYVEQACAARRAFPTAEIYFVVGFDKLIQILDHRYYVDRDSALRQLFGHVKLVVGARNGRERHDFDELLSLPANREFRDRVQYLHLPTTLQRQSATTVRNALSKAHNALSGDDLLRRRLPAETVEFVRASAAYLPPVRLDDGELIDRHALRSRLISILESDQPWAERHVNLGRWLTDLWSDSDTGKSLRQLMKSEPEAALKSFRALFFVNHRTEPQ